MKREKEQPLGFDNPYLQAKEEWFESVGPSVAAAAQWRIVAVVALVLAVLSITCNVIQASREKVVPYIVAVDNIRGMSVAVSRANQASPVPTSVIQYTIKEAIKNWRTVTPDLKLREVMSNDLTAVVRSSATGMLTEWFEVNSPVVRARSGRLVSIEVKGVTLPVSPTSWRIEWTETTRGHNGITIDTVQYEATMTVVIKPPTTDQEILRNPVGVYITELAFGTVLSKSKDALAASRDREVSQ